MDTPAAGEDFRFTGTELDDETGLYYFGARYYDPGNALWVSADPILASYLQGAPNGGVFRPENPGLYTHVWHSPVRLRDPDGNTVSVDSDFETQAVQQINRIAGVRAFTVDNGHIVRTATNFQGSGRQHAAQRTFIRMMEGVINDSAYDVALHRAENYEIMGGRHDLGGNNATIPTSADSAPDADGSPGAGSSANVWMVTRDGRPGSHSQQALEAGMPAAMGEELSHADQITRGVNPISSPSTCVTHPSPDGDEVIPQSEHQTHGYGPHPTVTATTQDIHAALGLPPDQRYLPPEESTDPRCVVRHR